MTRTMTAYMATSWSPLAPKITIYRYLCRMKTRTDRIHISLTAPRATVLAYDGVYFHDKGIEMEVQVQQNEVKNAVDASFDGFEVLSDFEQEQHLGSLPAEPSITAKLYYYVDIQVG